jgi:hypothetical protein
MISGVIMASCSQNVSAQYQMLVKTDDGLLYPFNVDRIESVSFLEVEPNENDIDLSVQTIWTGKSIAWFGTSIPAGTSAFRVPIKGNAISVYDSYKVTEKYFTKDEYLLSEYPVIAASLIGAKEIHNESQGSSRITRNATDPRLEIRCKALTNTVQEICSYVWGSYDIDIADRTYRENHDNTIGVTTFLTTTGTWKNFVDMVCVCLRQSYQICLTLRHLISDETQRSRYTADIFGDYYDDVANLLSSVGYTMDDIAGYHAIDLFVIEHSVNDSYTFMYPFSNFSVDSEDVNDFYGAYNKIISEILKYKPSVRIAIISNCGKTSIENADHEDKVSCLKRIAEKWQLPFCQMDLYTNVQWVSQLTQGYWDKEHYWHDSGFEWTEDVENDSFTTNATFNAAFYDESLAVMKAKINPQEINGVWYWEAPSVYLWMFDALHPHSDKSGRLTILIARVLSKWLLTIGNI